ASPPAASKSARRRDGHVSACGVPPHESSWHLPPGIRSPTLPTDPKPLHRSDSFDAHQHRARKLGIKLPHGAAFVQQRAIHHFTAYCVQHRQRLLASVQITSYNSHSASFVPSAVG